MRWRRGWRGQIRYWNPLHLYLRSGIISPLGVLCLCIWYLLLVLLLEEKRDRHHHSSLHSQDLRASDPPLNLGLLWKAQVLQDLAQKSWHQQGYTLCSSQALAVDLIFKMQQGRHHQLRGTEPESLRDPVQSLEDGSPTLDVVL